MACSLPIPILGMGRLSAAVSTRAINTPMASQSLIENLRQIRDDASHAMNEPQETYLCAAANTMQFCWRGRVLRSALSSTKTRSSDPHAPCFRSIVKRIRQPVLSLLRRYFSQPYKLDRIIYAGNEPSEAFREKLSRAIEETQKLLGRADTSLSTRSSI